MPKADVNDIEVYYEEQGSGFPLMMIIGLSGVGAGWGPQISLFSKNYRTFVPDHRGAGQSSAPPDGYTIEQLASDMAGLLRTADAAPAHVMGSSTGGAIAQVMALDHPEVVRSLTLVATWARPDAYFRRCFEVRKHILNELGREAYTRVSSPFLWSAKYIREHAGELEEWEERVLSGPANLDVMNKRIDMIVAHDQLERLGRIDKPTLVIVGQQDICTPPFYAEEITAAIPGAEMAVLEGGHFFYKEAPEPFYRRVNEFLSGVGVSFGWADDPPSE